MAITRDHKTNLENPILCQPEEQTLPHEGRYSWVQFNKKSSLNISLIKPSILQCRECGSSVWRLRYHGVELFEKDWKDWSHGLVGIVIALPGDQDVALSHCSTAKIASMLPPSPCHDDNKLTPWNCKPASNSMLQLSFNSSSHLEA